MNSTSLRRFVPMVLGVAMLLGTSPALADGPQHMQLTRSPDLVPVAGGDRDGPAIAPVSDPGKTWQTLFSEDFEGAFPGDDWSVFSPAGVPYWGVWDCWSGNSESHSVACAASGSGPWRAAIWGSPQA